jgi:hypothetical protein
MRYRGQGSVACFRIPSEMLRNVRSWHIPSIRTSAASRAKRTLSAYRKSNYRRASPGHRDIHRPDQQRRRIVAGQYTQNNRRKGWIKLNSKLGQLPQSAYFFGTKSEKGRPRFHSASPRDVRDGRWSDDRRARGWSRLTSRSRIAVPETLRDGRWLLAVEVVGATRAQCPAPLRSARRPRTGGQRRDAGTWCRATPLGAAVSSLERRVAQMSWLFWLDGSGA